MIDDDRTASPAPDDEGLPPPEAADDLFALSDDELSLDDLDVDPPADDAGARTTVLDAAPAEDAPEDASGETVALDALELDDALGDEATGTLIAPAAAESPPEEPRPAQEDEAWVERVAERVLERLAAELPGWIREAVRAERGER